jgi:hypothetical protein
MFRLNQKIRTWRQRDGISIIEVLTSMAVATIGVFGVMVMIPFAVKQSQTGLDNDAANAVGRNAVEEIQIQGLLKLESINRPDPTDPTVDLLYDGLKRIVIRPDGATENRHFNTEFVPAPWGFPIEDVIHLDPIGFSAGLYSFDIGGGVFTINSASLTNQVSTNELGFLPGHVFPAHFSALEANRLCRSSDDLVYASDVEGVLDTAPPQPIFDSSDGSFTKRQSIGRISWSMFLVPEKSPVLAYAPANRFRTFTVVYRDRFIDPLDLEGSSYSWRLTDMAGEGAETSVAQIDLSSNPVDPEEVVRGSWVMLINRIPLSAAGETISGSPPDQIPVAFEGYRTQVSFAKVTRVNSNGTAVSVDGGSFNFVDPDLPMAGPAGSTQTYLVHLKNAVNVYERSITVER